MENSGVDMWNLFLQINLRLTKLEELLKSFLLDKPPLTVKGGNSFFENIDSEVLFQLYSELSLLLQPLLEKYISRLAEIRTPTAKLIYLILFMFGPKHPSYFWRRLKIDRSGVHRRIKDLKEKGLIIIDGCTVKVPREEIIKF